MKRGFTLIELLVSIAVIGILMTIGYGGYTLIISNAKAAKVVGEIDSVKQAISHTLAKTGGYYQSTSYGPNLLGPEDPTSNCGTENSDSDSVIQYATDDGAQNDHSCFAHKVERVFHHELEQMGFRWVPNSDNPNQGQFRLNSFPLAKLVFPLQINGVRSFKIQGIPGNIAVRVLKKVNESDRIIDKDGWTRSDPLAIITYPASKPGVEEDCLNNLSSLNTTELSFICQATGKTTKDDAYTDNNNQPGLFKPGSENKISNYAQVGLIYTYEFGDRWDGQGGGDNTNTNTNNNNNTVQ